MAKNNAIDIDIETGGGNTYTFPSATSTLATLDLAETLTNKDLSDASNTLGSANVAAAGALMDSEVTNLAQVKAFDTTDYAAALGVDDNYVTDAEKTVIGNTSGTNSGDQDLSGLAPIANPTFTGEIGVGSVNVSETELGILEGLTASTAELNKMDGVTATTAEINYVDGVTSNIQTQLNAKAEDAADVGLGNVDNTSNATERAATKTVSGMRVTPRTNSTTTAATLTPDLATANVYYRTTQTATLTINAPTGTPVIGEIIIIYVDSAGAETLTMNSTYKAFGAAFPATTTAGKTLMISAQYNGTDWKTLVSEAQ